MGHPFIVKEAITALLREKRGIPDAIAAGSAVCFSWRQSSRHIRLTFSDSPSAAISRARVSPPSNPHVQIWADGRMTRQ
jgi:hypothetical protein